MRNTCLQTVHDLAKKDSRVIFIGSDLGPGVLKDFRREKPEQFFMEGVSEQAIIGIAAGLAMEGFKPYVNTIATFITRRCFEQVALDLCLHDLPVKLIGNGGGLVYATLGPTHLAIEDISILRPLPNMTIVAPCDSVEMKSLMKKAIDWPHPIYIRLARGGDKIITKEEENFTIGKSVIKKEPGDALFITTGTMTQIALEATKLLEKKNISCGVMHMPTIKPLDHDALSFWIPKVKKVITVEENTLMGGFGSSILEFCSENMQFHTPKISRIGLRDKFTENYGNHDELLEKTGLTVKTLYEKVLNNFK